jgi:hypothetical protein
MAASVEISFNAAALLHAVSVLLDATLLDTDAEVIKALQSYGVRFSKAKLPASKAVARLNLLACLIWIVASIVSVASISSGSHILSVTDQISASVLPRNQ